MVIKFLHVILLASVKYILTLPYAMIIGMKYPEALTAVLLGGIGGFLFFYYLSKKFLLLAGNVWPCICKAIPLTFKARYEAFCEKRRLKKTTKIFSRRNRFLARFRTTYGLWGIILATPVILTIPIGAFLANKYYSRQRHIVLYMILSIVGWAGVLSGLIHLFPKVFL